MKTWSIILLILVVVALVLIIVPAAAAQKSALLADSTPRRPMLRISLAWLRGGDVECVDFLTPSVLCYSLKYGQMRGYSTIARDD